MDWRNAKLESKTFITEMPDPYGQRIAALEAKVKELEGLACVKRDKHIDALRAKAVRKFFKPNDEDRT